MVLLQIWVKNLVEKQEIRKQILALRESISEEEWREKTRHVAGKVMEHPAFLRAETIYCYIDFRREVGTRGIIEKAWELNKKVAVPRTEGKRMEFYYISSFEEIHKGRFGILEPEQKEKASGRDGLMLMPGAVFDHKLHRIGYGGGFYDRYLETHTGLFLMALAFEFQVLTCIPHGEYDIRPHVLVTEERIETREDAYDDKTAQ